MNTRRRLVVCAITAALGLTSPLTAVADTPPPTNAEPDTITKTFDRDTDTVILNPEMGWLMYAEEFGRPFPDPNSPDEQDHFWQIVEKNNRLKDAAAVYIRVPWSRMNPKENQYAWQPGVDPLYKRFIDKAKAHHKKLAFRVFIDSKDTHMQATPQWVLNKVPRHVTYPSSHGYRNPDLDNPQFKREFEKFLMAFGKEYDDPSLVEFVDLNTFGAWGEMHGAKWMNPTKWARVLQWLDDSYMKAFKNVMLAMNFANSPYGYSAYQHSVDLGTAMRRDGVGSIRWFAPETKRRIKANFPRSIFIAENCYQAFDLWDHSCDSGFKPQDKMLTRVVDEALDLHANFLDLRKAVDVRTFVDKYPQLVQKFGVEGGYRIAPTSATFPTRLTQFTPGSFDITWENTAVGRLPNGLKNLEDRWRIAYALRSSDGRIVKMIASSIDPGTLYKSDPAVSGSGPRFETVTIPTDVPAGTYTLETAILDRTLGGAPGVKLALKSTDFSADPTWTPIGDIAIIGSGAKATPTTVTVTAPPSTTTTTVTAEPVTVTKSPSPVTVTRTSTSTVVQPPETVVVTEPTTVSATVTTTDIPDPVTVTTTAAPVTVTTTPEPATVTKLADPITTTATATLPPATVTATTTMPPVTSTTTVVPDPVTVTAQPSTVTQTKTATVTVTQDPQVVTTTLTAPPGTVTETVQPLTVTVVQPPETVTTTLQPATKVTTTTLTAPAVTVTGQPVTVTNPPVTITRAPLTVTVTPAPEPTPTDASHPASGPIVTVIAALGAVAAAALMAPILTSLMPGLTGALFPPHLFG